MPLLALAWGVGQIGLPFSESGSIHIFGLALPLEDGSTIIASITPCAAPGRLAATMRVEEIAPQRASGRQQAASLATLVTLARGFTQPLADNAANNGLRELLKTAAVTQKRERVIVTATLTPSLLTGLAAAPASSGPDTSQNPATVPVPSASK